MLLAANLIDEVQMQIALAEQKRTGRRFGSTLVDLKFIDENVLAAFLSRQIDIPCISLLHIDIPKKVLRKMNRTMALECQSIPVRVDEGRLDVAMVDPTDLDLLARLEDATAMIVTPLIAPESSITTMIDKFYPPEFDEDSTVSQRATTVPATDPNFLDLIEELDNADIDTRLTRIEDRLERIWTLLERVLRELEVRR
jgi:MshEN domain